MPAFEVRGYAICIGHYGPFGPPSPGSQGSGGDSEPPPADAAAAAAAGDSVDIDAVLADVPVGVISCQSCCRWLCRAEICPSLC